MLIRYLDVRLHLVRHRMSLLIENADSVTPDVNYHLSSHQYDSVISADSCEEMRLAWRLPVSFDNATLASQRLDV